MEIFRYKKALIIFLIYSILFTILFLSTAPLAEEKHPDATPFIFGSGVIEAFLSVVVYLPIMAIVGGFLISYILVPVFLLIHKKIIGKNIIYGIQERPRPKKFKKTFQAFFPSILAINFFLIATFNQDLLELIFTEEFFITTQTMRTRFVGYGMILPTFTIGIAMSLFSPAWFLLDAGISYSNQEKVEGTEKPIEVKTMGGWYLNFLKGYTGIGVIVTNYLVMLQFLGPQNGWDLGAITNSITSALFVFLLTIASIPAVILLDITKDHRIKYVRKWASKFGITKKVAISLQEIS